MLLDKVVKEREELRNLISQLTTSCKWPRTFHASPVGDSLSPVDTGLKLPKIKYKTSSCDWLSCNTNWTRSLTGRLGSCKLGWEVWEDLDDNGIIEILNSDESSLLVVKVFPSLVEVTFSTAGPSPPPGYPPLRELTALPKEMVMPFPEAVKQCWFSLGPTSLVLDL